MLSAVKLLQEAQTTTGLDDYGDPDFSEGFKVLVDAINNEAGLTADNEVLFRSYLLRILANCLRMQRDIVRHPEILDQEILPPIFITSLPRTGSTKLHRMLAASGDFNTMNYWQVYNFAPFSDAVCNPDPRIAAAKRHLEWMWQRSPLLMASHPMYADETEEESQLLDAGFNSIFSYGILLNVPSYIGWVLTQDPIQIFKGLRRKLQYMQWQYFPDSKRRWLLKTPALLGMEKLFSEVFVGADFIVTHRHPEQIMSSCCTLFRGFRALYNETDSADVAGENILANFGETVKGHLRWRDAYQKNKVFDVGFDEIVADELKMLPKVYAFLNIPFSGQSRNGVEAWLAMEAARRQPPSYFTLADYGLDAAGVNARFAGYIERYAQFL